jgi:hypothetical protein
MGRQLTNSKTPQKWDLFISHASEDKKDFVEPLAGALTSFGVRVWYDDYTLQLGDSLSRNIDKGLANSDYGLVVLSPAFFAKKWPEYELRGLIAKEHAGDKVILPIWHNVTNDEVLKFSPPLADKLAVKTDNLTPTQIAIRVIQSVRPDIFQILRRLTHLHALASSKVENRKISEIKVGPIRHKKLPPNLVSRVRLVRASLLSAYPHSMAFWLNGFQRDSHPSDEVAYWEHVAAVYQEYLGLLSKPLARAKRTAVFHYIFALQAADKKINARGSKGLPKGAAKIIQDLYKYNLPPYGYTETFPEAIGIRSENEAGWTVPDDIDAPASVARMERSAIRGTAERSVCQTWISLRFIQATTAGVHACQPSSRIRTSMSTPTARPANSIRASKNISKPSSRAAMAPRC